MRVAETILARCSVLGARCVYYSTNGSPKETQLCDAAVNASQLQVTSALSNKSAHKTPVELEHIDPDLLSSVRSI